MNFSVETTINAVVVFPDRARVTARGSINASEGVHELTIGDLPMVMDPESVRVSGAGTAGVRIRSVDVRRRHYEKSPSADVRALEDQIQNLRNDLQGYDDAAAVKSASLEHLAGLRRATTEYADGLARGKSSIDHQGQLIRFFEDEDTRLRSELRQLGIQQRELHESIAKLQSELEELRSAQARQRMIRQLAGLVGVTHPDLGPEQRVALDGDLVQCRGRRATRAGGGVRGLGRARAGHDSELEQPSSQHLHRSEREQFVIAPARDGDHFFECRHPGCGIGDP